MSLKTGDICPCGCQGTIIVPKAAGPGDFDEEGDEDPCDNEDKNDPNNVDPEDDWDQNGNVGDGG